MPVVGASYRPPRSHRRGTATGCAREPDRVRVRDTHDATALGSWCKPGRERRDRSRDHDRQPAQTSQNRRSRTGPQRFSARPGGVGGVLPRRLRAASSHSGIPRIDHHDRDVTSPAAPQTAGTPIHQGSTVGSSPTMDIGNTHEESKTRAEEAARNIVGLPPTA